MKKRGYLTILFLVLISIAAQTVFASSHSGLANVVLKFNDVLDLYDRAPLFFDAILLIALFTSIFQAGFKRGLKNMDKRVVSVLSVTLSIATTLSFIFWLRSKGTSLFAVGGPVASTIIASTLLILLFWVVFKSVHKKHRWTVIFSGLFVIHFVLLNAVEWYPRFLENNQTIGGIVSIIVLISGIFLGFGLVGLFFKAITKGKTAATEGLLKTDEEMKKERKYEAQKEERGVRKAERQGTRLLRRESSKINKAKKVISEIVRLLAGGSSAIGRNIGPLRDQMKELKKLNMGIGGYVGLSSNLVEKVERRLDATLKGKYVPKLETFRSELLMLEKDINKQIGELVVVTKDPSKLDTTKAKSIANGLGNLFSKVLRFSEGLVALEREIHEDLETARKI